MPLVVFSLRLSCTYRIILALFFSGSASCSSVLVDRSAADLASQSLRASLSLFTLSPLLLNPFNSAPLPHSTAPTLWLCYMLAKLDLHRLGSTLTHTLS